MKGILTLIILAAIGAGVFALGKVRSKDGDKPILKIAEEVALTVDVAKPQRGEIVRIVQAPGDVEAVLEVEVSSEIVSKIEEMPVEEGDLVKKGDLLCRLDDRFLKAEVESAQAVIYETLLAPPEGEQMPWARGLAARPGGPVPVLDLAALVERLTATESG